MATTHKAVVFRDEFASEFLLRRPLLTQTKSTSTDGSPMLLVGAAATTNEGFFLKIALFTDLNKDVLGLSQNTYARHVAQICFEANTSGGSGADTQLWPSHLPAIAMLALKGIKIEVYEETAGTVPSETTITGSKLKASFEGHVQYPGMASM